MPSVKPQVRLLCEFWHGTPYTGRANGPKAPGHDRPDHPHLAPSPPDRALPASEPICAHEDRRHDRRDCATCGTITRGGPGPGLMAGAVLPVRKLQIRRRNLPARSSTKESKGFRPARAPNVVRLGWRPGTARNSPPTVTTSVTSTSAQPCVVIGMEPGIRAQPPSQRLASSLSLEHQMVMVLRVHDDEGSETVYAAARCLALCLPHRRAPAYDGPGHRDQLAG